MTQAFEIIHNVSSPRILHMLVICVNLMCYARVTLGYLTWSTAEMTPTFFDENFLHFVGNTVLIIKVDY